MGVEGREMAARAGRDPAADGRELEALGKVAKRQAVRLERRLERRPEHAALDARRAARAIDLEHPVQALQIEADRAGEAVADGRLDAADDARAAAERDHRGAGSAAHSSTALTSSSDCGLRNHIRRVVEVAREGAHGVRERLAVGVQQALVGLGRAQTGEPGRRPSRGGAQRHVVDRRAGCGAASSRPKRSA